MLTTANLIQEATRRGTAVPGFNIPYLPMLEPTVRVLRDQGKLSDAEGQQKRGGAPETAPRSGGKRSTVLRWPTMARQQATYGVKLNNRKLPSNCPQNKP